MVCNVKRATFNVMKGKTQILFVVVPDPVSERVMLEGSGTTTVNKLRD